MATKNEIRPPMLAAGNPAPEPVELRPAQDSGWGEVDGMPGLDDNTPTLTYDQVQKEEQRPQPPQTPTNKVRVPLRNTTPTTPGGVNLDMPRNPIAEKHGVLAGRPEVLKYDHLINALGHDETEEERQQREKRERRNALFAAIGDGVSALSNLYFTTKGAPSADQSKTLSKAADELVEKNKKEREDRYNRRMALLKEQRAERDRLREQDIRERREARLEQYQRDRLEALYTRLENERKAKEAETNRKREEGVKKAENDAKKADSYVETQKTIQEKNKAQTNATNQKAAAGGTTGKSSTKNKKTNKKKASKAKPANTPKHTNVSKLGL